MEVCAGDFHFCLLTYAWDLICPYHMWKISMRNEHKQKVLQKRACPRQWEQPTEYNRETEKKHMDTYCPLLLFAGEHPPPPCLLVVLHLVGGKKKGRVPLARLVLVLPAWAIAPTAGSCFLHFPEWSWHCALRQLCAASPGLLCHSLVKTKCLVRLLRPKHTQLSHSAPSPAWKNSNQLSCSHKMHGCT